ncbi:MAG: hypothetical protein RBS78_01020 [Coriobacteriia bacterium]|nr:hypothetical protein [Coriobacteriia bacterium]
MSERPVIDYAALPYLPREGVQAAGNNQYLTRSLFLETASTKEQEALALWTMSEHEVFANGKWYPSAWMVYIHATDEYDALRKICGNVRQWEHIKAMFEKVGRAHILEAWEAEQRYLQKSRVRAALEKTAIVPGAPGQTAAAKMLLAMVEGKGRGPGRPKQEKPNPESEKAKSAAEEAISRVVDFQK